MASIRRTLSPVPRAEILLNGEAHLVPSPLSRSSSHSQNQLEVGEPFSTVYNAMDSNPVLYRIQTFVLNILSQRSSRSPERYKSKGGPFLRKSFIHFFVCFMVGVFLGLTPFLFPENFVSKYQTSSFDVTPTTFGINYHRDRFGNLAFKKNETFEPESMKRYAVNRISNETAVSQKSIQGTILPYRTPLIIVTPTYAMPFQAYYLNRLAHTLKLVPAPLLWIVVELSSQSVETADILRRVGVMYRHLICDKNITSSKDRGAEQRNVALSHIEKHRLDGIVYFADDDNVYSIELFEQMREIRRFGTWPVAMLAKSKNRVVLEGPVCNNTHINGWHTNGRTKNLRRFHANMSGFAFNSTILWDPKRWHRYNLQPIRQLHTVKEGFQESTFIEQVVEDESQMEGLVDCSRILLWHLHIESSHLFYPRSWLAKKSLDVIEPL